MAVEDLYTKACDAVERANYDYAIELLREVLRQNPQYPDARIALRGTERRRLQEKGGSHVAFLGQVVTLPLTAIRGAFAKPRQRLEVYEDFLEKDPSSFWGLAHAAAAARKAGLLGEAAQIYRDALHMRPSHKQTLRAIGDVLAESGQHQEALKYLTRLSALEPRNRDLDKEVRDLAATDHMTSHEMEGASSFRDMIRDRDQAARLEESGRMAVTMDDLQQRIGSAEKELAEHPHNVTRVLGLAKLYQDTGQLGKAQKLLREEHQARPDGYEVRERLGDVQLLMYDEAVKKAGEQAEKSPADAGATAKKRELEERKVKFAVKEYRWRLQQHPTERHLQLALGRMYFEMGSNNEAIAAFQSASQDARYELESSRMLGLCFMQKGQYDLALEQFQRAVERHPDLDDEGKELRYSQAQAYEQMGKKAEALGVYKKIYSQDINFRDVAQKVDALS
jgi:tetratricopeptide (TPR) repeat protein